MSIEYFILPFEGKLDHNNRWVQLVNIIPWDKIEEKYSSLFPENKGNVAKPARLSLGALIISATARTVPVVAVLAVVKCRILL
jgi:IS5 family transposase